MFFEAEVFRVSIRRGDRVAEGARLEIVCRGNSTVGSNPTLSAISLPRPERSRIAEVHTRRGARVVEWGGLENR